MTTKRRVLGAVLVLFGLGIAGLYGFVVLRGRAAENWPTTSGRIVDRTVTRTTTKRTKYRPVITFAFEWEGKEVRSSTLSGDFMQPTYSTEQDAAAAAAEYAPNQAVTVHVDESNPERSVLLVGVQPETHALLVGVVVCLLLGWLNLRSSRPS